MKKTKLLTSIAALALVLGLGACEVNIGDVDANVNSSEDTSEDESTGESSSESETTPEPTAYVLVGDFTDSNWDNEPATDSKYFIPAETEEFKVTVTTASEPDYGEYDPWYAGLSVVEYGTWNRVAGYTELDEASTGVKGSSTSNDVSLAWNTTYDVTLTFGETNSILVELVEETYDGDPVADLLADVKENNNYSLTIEYYDWTSPTYDSESGMYQDFENDTISKNSERHYIVDLTCTKDVFCLEYYYGYNDWLSGRTYDIEIYVNNGSNLDVYFINNAYDTTIFKYTTYNGYSWQTYWTSNSLLGLDNYLDHFVVDLTSYDGSKVDYSITIDTVDFLGVLIDALYHCGNYYAEGNYVSNITPFINNYKTYWNTLGEPYQNCTYSFDKEEWDTTLYYLEENVTAVNQNTDEYQLKYHGVSAYVSEVGTSVIADLYTTQFS